MWESAEAGEENDLVSVGRIKLRKPCHRLVRPIGAVAQEIKKDVLQQAKIRYSSCYRQLSKWLSKYNV